MLRTHLAASSLLLLAACDQSAVETKRSLAEAHCLGRALQSRAWAGLAQAEDGDAELAGLIIEPPTPEFRFVSTGQFVIDFGVVAIEAPKQSFRLTCMGDFNASALTSLQIDGRLYRPQATESWTF